MRHTLVLVVLLTGCVSAEQRAANIQATFGPRCEAMGFARDTQPWRQCIVQLQGQAMDSFNRGADAYRANQPQPVMAPMPQQPVRTTCIQQPNGITNCVTR